MDVAKLDWRDIKECNIAHDPSAAADHSNSCHGMGRGTNGTAALKQSSTDRPGNQVLNP